MEAIFLYNAGTLYWLNGYWLERGSESHRRKELILDNLVMMARRVQRRVRLYGRRDFLPLHLINQIDGYYVSHCFTTNGRSAESLFMRARDAVLCFAYPWTNEERETLPLAVLDALDSFYF